MSAATRLSTKGQVVIPKVIRERLGWPEGAELEIVEHGDAVLLRKPARKGSIPAVQAFAEARRILNYQGPVYSDADWDRSLDEMFRDWKG